MNERRRTPFKINQILQRKYLFALLGSLVIFLGCVAILGIITNLIMPAVRQLLTPYETTIPLTSPQDLLLNSDDLPNPWKLGVEMDYPESYFQFTGDVAGRWYIHPNNSEFKKSGIPDPAFHIVARYAFAESAQKEVRELAGTLGEGEDLDWQFESSADEFLYNCVMRDGVRGRTTVCEFISRYGEYVSFFSIYPEITELDSEEIATILTKLDQKFNSIITSR